MVHALHESWRVLAEDGTLIDARPYCVEAPLEVLFRGRVETAGMVDLSHDYPDDLAADEAIRAVVKEGIFREVKSDAFDFVYYWRSMDDLLEDWDAQWKEFALLPGDVIGRAKVLLKKHDPRTLLRIRLNMKLVMYEKQ